MSENPASHLICSISVIGGFLDGTRFDLADGLNCIIGARGTGKTTVVECIACALDTLPNVEHTPQERKRVETLIKRNLDGGPIELGIRTKDGTAYKVTRSFGDEPIVLDGDGAPAAVSLKAGLFRAEIYRRRCVSSPRSERPENQAH